MNRTRTLRHLALLFAWALALPAASQAVPQPFPDGLFQNVVKLVAAQGQGPAPMMATDNIDGMAFSYRYAMVDLEASVPALRGRLQALAREGTPEVLHGMVTEGRLAVTGIGPGANQPRFPPPGLGRPSRSEPDLEAALDAAAALYEVGIALRDSGDDPETYQRASHLLRAAFRAARTCREAPTSPAMKTRARALGRQAGVAIQDLRGDLD